MNYELPNTVNIFYFKDINCNEKVYLKKDIGTISAYTWLHENCESIGADGFYFKGNLCYFERAK